MAEVVAFQCWFVGQSLKFPGQLPKTDKCGIACRFPRGVDHERCRTQYGGVLPIHFCIEQCCSLAAGAGVAATEPGVGKSGECENGFQYLSAAQPELGGDWELIFQQFQRDGSIANIEGPDRSRHGHQFRQIEFGAIRICNGTERPEANSVSSDGERRDCGGPNRAMGR